MKKKSAKPKKISYRLIERDSIAGLVLYPILEELVEKHHEELRDARIALAWNLSWKPDVDGRVILGKCKKATDLDRELAAFDFVIILRQAFFEDAHVNDVARRALIDHELCHAAVKHDENGEPVIDERGRTVYRIRKHDLEEFSEIVDRHGVWKKDIEAFAGAIERARAKSTTWTGYGGLRDKLAAVGANVSLEAILEWTIEQRRDAEVWARVQYELKKRGVGVSMIADWPFFIRQAMYQPPATVPTPTPAQVPSESTSDVAGAAS